MEKRYVGPIPGRVLCFELEEYGREEHCCAEMNLHIHEKEKIIKYLPVTREYGVQAADCVIQTLAFCPWCGKSLPRRLRSEFFDYLKEEYNIEADIGDLSKVPKEFQTDEWWRKRGL
jgi:hypothetical protein